MPKIFFIEPDGTERLVDALAGGSVMEAAVRNAVRGIDADCGGACACATCHVHVDPTWWPRLDPPAEMELSLLEFADEVTEYSRLSCQIRMDETLAGLTVRVPGSGA